MAMTYPTLTECFLKAVEKYANPRAQIHRTAKGWEPIAAEEMLHRVAALSQALAALGVKSGDRVALLAPNCPEWHIADFAVLGLGAVNVPIYFNESTDRMLYILSDSGAKVAIVAGEHQVRQLTAERERVVGLEHIIAVSPPADLGGDILRYESLVAESSDSDISEYQRRAKEVSPEQLASIIYTSGTTGEPKGVMLSHANLSSNALDSFADHDIGPADVAMSFLPLAHVFERMVDYAFIFHGVSIAYVEQIDHVAQALLEVRPTIAAAVPRFFEKSYANILEQGHREKGLRRRIFDWSIEVAERAIPWRCYGNSASLGARLAWSIANRMVYSKIRAGLGGRIRMFISGGAPLSLELAEFFWSIGVVIYQGYGLSETSPAVSSNAPGANKLGTVGRPIRNIEVSIAEDGEILVRGPCVMQGYYGKPDQTREALMPDGWLGTGDIGYLDADGYLVITDRKKELLKTAAGKFVAPQLIENRLKTSPFIANAIAVGDRRKFISVLVVPNFATIRARALNEGKQLLTPAEICANPWVRDLIGREIERLCSNLAQYEKPKRFALLDQDFSISNGELTFTMKMKRRIIEERYRDVIVQLYADVEEPRPLHPA